MANMELIKKLRESTGCGMSDCNKALKENNDDYEKAVEWLRKKGLSSAEKKSSRITSEGVIGIKNNGNIASILEVNSETDFVARNDKFQNFVNSLLNLSLNVSEEDSYKFVDVLKNTKFNSNELVSDVLTNNIAVIGENIQIRRGKTLTIQDGLIVSYLHNVVSEGLGKIGVLVSLKSDADKNELEEFGKGIAMHIAASKPEFLKESDVSVEKLTKEKDIARELAKKSGKPDNIVEKMVEGRIKKFYEETVLLDQLYIMDTDKKVSEVLKDFEKKTNKHVEIVQYELFILGQGIEKKSQDFASEVASMIK